MILESIDKIEEYVDNLSKEEFNTNTLIQDAVFRRLMIIGEAVKNIPIQVKEKHPEIPWKNIAGMRDVITHQYAGVKLKRIWSVIEKNLPTLKINIQKIKDD